VKPSNLFSSLLVLLPIRATAQPKVDYHQHLFNRELKASDLVSLLNAAGMERALVLSVAYQLGNPNKPPVAAEDAKVRAENDWTSQQVATFPDRLRGFCGVNPLKDYAIAEIMRCAQDPQLHFGLKLHFGNSDVDLRNPEHIAKLKKCFGRATSTAWRSWSTCIPR
jgi:predicted TIM-barrel fold metal-dependent hydrolase